MSKPQICYGRCSHCKTEGVMGIRYRLRNAAKNDLGAVLLCLACLKNGARDLQEALQALKQGGHYGG